MSIDLTHVYPLGARPLPDTPAVQAALAKIDALRNSAVSRPTLVSERALVKRINRKLTRQPSPMRMCVLSEHARGYNDLGRYFVVGGTSNFVEFPHADIEGWGRELGVLGAKEAMA